MSKEDQKESTIRSHYIELSKCYQNEEYEKAIKAVNKILNLAPDDTKAAHCKVVCFIQVSKFNEAIQFIDRLKLNGLLFERAYCEYRLNQPEKALQTIDSAGIESLSHTLKELRAQILYRLERFEECFEIYRDIIKNTHDDVYEDERATNLSAVAANLAIEGSEKEISGLREDTHDLCYNSACALAGRGKYSDAERKLRACEKMCRDTMVEDGANEEEIESELATIRVQLAYCLQMQGRIKEASAIYLDILKLKTNEPAIIAVISNNLVAINKDQNVFDSKKKIRSAMSEACEHKLTARQKKIIAINNCLLSVYTNQADQLQQICSKLVQSYPDMEFEAILIRVTQLSQDKKFKEAIGLLENYLKTCSDNDLAPKFAIVQLLLLSGNKKGAIDILQSMGESKYKPGVVSALVSLLLGIDNKPEASKVLEDAVEWYKTHGSKSGDLSDMWRQAADFHLRGGKAETAAKSLEELYKNNPQDMKILAQLVIAYSQFDPKKAHEASKQLPALDTLSNVAEIDQLEATNWMMSTKAVRKTAATTKGEQSPDTPASDKTAKKKRQRKRKGKLPKNYVEGVAPDPERWLPKYERTGFRRKRDRRTKEVIKGSQGMATGAADQYDMSKAQNLTKQSPVTQTYQESTPGPRQYRKSHQKKKKGRY